MFCLHGVVHTWPPGDVRAKVAETPVCVSAEPLPTWAAPATPPRVSQPGSPRREGRPDAKVGQITDTETGVPADTHSNGVASESDDGMLQAEENSVQMRARLEATRNELVEKMAELRKLEANLSVALGEKPTAWSTPSVDASKSPDLAAQHLASLGAQPSADMRDRSMGVLVEELEGEGAVESLEEPAKPKSRARRTKGSDENLKDASLSTSSSPETKKDPADAETARSAPSRPAVASSSRSGSASGRVTALLSAPPVSARLSLRREKRAPKPPKAPAPLEPKGGPLSASAAMASKLRRSSSARELTGRRPASLRAELPVPSPGAGQGLQAADVARLVASPEIGAITLAKSGSQNFRACDKSGLIRENLERTEGAAAFVTCPTPCQSPDSKGALPGTLNDFLPNPTPEPEASDLKERGRACIRAC